MKNARLLRNFALLAGTLLLSAGVHAQISMTNGPVPAVPNTKAILDLNDGSNRGFLIPRMTYAQRPATPANSLLIYQTDSATITIGGVNYGQPAGFYYFDGPPVNQWLHITWGSSWKLGGNANTNPATNFIGTTNSQPLVLRSNGVARAQVAVGQQVQIGPSPFPAVTERMDVNGAVRIKGQHAASSNEGAIKDSASTHWGYVNNPLGAGEISYVGWYELENVFLTRTKQRYQSQPVVACNYPSPVVIPSGGTAGSWPLLDDLSIPNATTAATTETPYSTFWEDGRHQYLYQSAQLQSLNVCPGTDIKGLAFQTQGTGTTLGMRNVRISLKNTTTGALNNFQTGLTQVYQVANAPGPAWVASNNGWNSHVFNGLPFQWTGPGFNMVVEYCFDNQDWTSNTPIFYEPVGYTAMIGLYCDACGSPTGGSTCYYTGPCNANPNLPPTGPPVNSPGVLCIGWGYNGLLGGGCNWNETTSLVTCDGTFQYQGIWTTANRRPVIKIDAQVNAVGIVNYNGSYIVAQDALVIGDYNTWARSSLYVSPNYQYRGPGTLSAQSSVWGGGVLLSDHVFDQYYDGLVKPEDARQAMGYQHYGVKEMAKYMEREHHLPTIAGRDEWNKTGSFSLDNLTNQIWVTVEEQSLYIKELNERMDALQKYLVEKRLKELKKN